METHEVLERTEKAEEASKHREHFGRLAALAIAIMAALLAIASIAGSRATTETVLSQSKATDSYNEYQANSLKRHINENAAVMLRYLAEGGPHEADGFAKAADLEAAVANRYRPNQDRLLPVAQGYEEERDRAESRHRDFQFAEAAFQIGIVLASIAIIAHTRQLLWAGGALGLIGFLGTLNGFFLWVGLPI